MGPCRKFSFASRGEAKRFVRERQRSMSGVLYPYLCHCGAWHLTSRERKVARARARALRRRAA